MCICVLLINMAINKGFFILFYTQSVEKVCIYICIYLNFLKYILSKYRFYIENIHIINILIPHLYTVY